MANFAERFDSLARSNTVGQDPQTTNNILVLGQEIAEWANSDANPSEKQLKLVLDLVRVYTSRHKMDGEWPTRAEVMAVATYINSCRS